MSNFEDELEVIKTDNDIDKFKEVVKEADTPEKAAALTELLDEESNSPETPIEDKVEDKTKTAPEAEPEKPISDEKPIVEKAKEEIPLDTKKPFVIDDEFIAKADPKNKTILESLKGETVSQKALDNYINAQRKLGEQGNELGQLRKQTEIKQPIPEKIPLQQQTLEKQVKDAIFTETIKRLKPDFPDIPTDPAELNDYVELMSRAQYDDYRDKKNAIQKEVENDFNTAFYKINNHAQINDTYLNNDLISIKNDLKEWGIEDPKSLGFELDPTDEDKKTLDALLLKDGKFDSNLVEYYGQDADNKPIYLFKEGAIRDKFFKMNTSKIFKLFSENLRSNIRKETIEKVTELQNFATNTATKPKGTGGLTDSSGSFVIRDINDVRRLGDTPERAKAVREALEKG